MLGTWLAHALRARGDEVWIVSRSAAPNPAPIAPVDDDAAAPPPIRRLHWDPTKGLAPPRPLDGLDGLFNLAGAPLADRPWTTQRRKVLTDSRIKSTEALLAAFEQLDAPPKVFVGVSSLGLFGDRGDDVIDDDDPPGTGFLAELCVAWEAAQLSADGLGCRSVVLRMSVVLSPTGGAFPLMVRPFRVVGGWLGHGRQYTPWISVEDAIRALIHLADTPTCRGGFNGTVPDAPQNKEWLKALGRAMHRPVVTHAPRWALRGALGELAESLLISSVRAAPRKLLGSGFTFVDTDAEATFTKLLAALAATQA